MMKINVSSIFWLTIAISVSAVAAEPRGAYNEAVAVEPRGVDITNTRRNNRHLKGSKSKKTENPTVGPTSTPTVAPTTRPSTSPTTSAPTLFPTGSPTTSPTTMPTDSPTTRPTTLPPTTCENLCTMTITQHVKLLQDWQCASSDVIRIKDGATLDCDGYTIRGNGGIYGHVSLEGTAATIKNCNIENFAYGIRAVTDEGEDGTIDNVTITGSTRHGIVYSQDGMTLRDVTVSGNGRYGIVLEDNPSGSVFENLKACDNGYGALDDDCFLGNIGGLFSGTLICDDCDEINYDAKTECNCGMALVG